MNKIIAIMAVVALTGCSVDTSGKHEIEDLEIETTATVDFLQTEVKQVNGVFYVRTSLQGVTIDCMAFSPSVLYSAEWHEIAEADSARLEQGADYSSEEMAECLVIDEVVE